MNVSPCLADHNDKVKLESEMKYSFEKKKKNETFNKEMLTVKSFHWLNGIHSDNTDRHNSALLEVAN